MAKQAAAPPRASARRVPGRWRLTAALAERRRWPARTRVALRVGDVALQVRLAWDGVALLAPRALDLVEVAAALWRADAFTAPGRQTRDAGCWQVTMPVVDLGFWQWVEARLARSLYVLTGDAYVFRFVEGAQLKGHEPADTQGTGAPAQSDCTVLLSGGIDSFAAAARALAAGKRTLLLCCRDGNPATINAQEHVARSLKQCFPGRVQMAIVRCEHGESDPPRRGTDHPGSMDGNGATRFLHMAVGVAACQAHGINELIVPACGQPPLDVSSPGREASWSRSDSGGLVAIARLNEVLAAAAVPVQISNPCAYATKTGLIREFLQPHFSPAEIRGTVSCIRAGHNAWPCGGCTKCLLRSVAMAAAGLEPERHAIDPLAMDTESCGSTNLLALLQFTRDMRRAEALGTPPWFESLVYGLVDVCPRRAMSMLRRLADEATIALHAVPPESRAWPQPPRRVG